MTVAADPQGWAHLRAAGVGVVVTLEDGSPVLRHWGADLGALDEGLVTDLVQAHVAPVTHSSVDVPRRTGPLVQGATGQTGRPSVTGHRRGRHGVVPFFRDWDLRGDLGLSASGSDGAGGEVRCTSLDEEAGLALTWRLRLTAAGVVLLDLELRNTGDTAYDVASLLPVLPVPGRAQELLDLTGRWTRERAPQRRPFHQGAWVRESRHGRTGHDATLLLVAGTPAFSFGTGEVWGVHVAWSGDHLTYAEATPEGELVLGGGELLEPGEVVIEPGAAYSSPTLVASWSDAGLDGLSARLHTEVRGWPHLQGSRRPVLLNTWEAVYFDHDLDRLRALADVAARTGVERFVLDDGWFAGRTDDRRGLGDWQVDPVRWAGGLHPLVDHVRSLGMEFGLWVEPEMVNEDSDLARAHPEWLLRGRTSLPPEWRHQQVLDLQDAGAYAHVRDALVALLDEYDIAFLKWDHNRDVFDVSHQGSHAVHGQTLAVYRLLDELRAHQPSLEIETCASGGGRVDLGILRRTHRLWASDTIDALERQHIQRWTQLLVPPELVGAHVGGPVAHTTGRRHRLGFRAASALLGHLGIEWNLLEASPEELDELAAWVALHKEVRPLVATGRLVRPEHPDPATLVTGVVAPDAGEACYVVAQVAASATTRPLPVLLTGLDPSTRYRVEVAGPPGAEPLVQLHEPPWVGSSVTLTGAVLGEVGLQLPVLAPESARVLRLTRVG